MEKQSFEQNSQEAATNEKDNKIKQAKNIQVAGLQAKQGQSFVARRGKASQTMPPQLATRPKETSKYAQAIIASLKLNEEGENKENEQYKNRVLEEDSSSSSNSSDRPLQRTSTYFPESDLMSNFDMIQNKD